MNNVSIIIPEITETPNLRNSLSSNCNIVQTDSTELIQEEKLPAEYEIIKNIYIK